MPVGATSQGPSFAAIVGGCALSLLSVVFGALALWMAVAIALSRPIEGMASVSAWFWSVLFGALATVGAGVCFRASGRMAEDRRFVAREVSAAVLITSCLATGLFLFGVSLISV